MMRPVGPDEPGQDAGDCQRVGRVVREPDGQEAEDQRTRGAPEPEVLVQQVAGRLKALGVVSVRKLAGIEETVKFPLPKGLRL